jgi:plasmid stabilization system protein ParE
MQNKAVEFHLGAALEYDSTFEWYLERSEVAASRFIVEVELALVAIGENPDRWPLGRRGTRKFILPNFPFALIYREFPSKIQIIAVAHGKRRPDYWKERL